MSVNVIFFASLRETVGKSHEQVTFREGLTVQQIWNEQTDPKIPRDRVLVAINQEYADFESPVNDHDEVAFFPPVTGG